jgi:hypothetical protein
MPSTRARTLLLVQSLVLAGVGCSAEGASVGPVAGGTAGAVGGRTGGAGGASGGEVSGAGVGGTALGGSFTTGGANPAGGSAATGGAAATGGTTSAGGSSSTGGNASGGMSAAGGSTGLGGTTPAGGSRGKGGGRGSGGSSAIGGSSPTGGTTSSAGGSATGGSSGQGNCSFTVTTNSTSSKMATVGVVEWSTSLSNPSSAQIAYTLDNAASGILNKGGTAPVDVTQTNHRTLLLGLKQSSTYTFHIEATSSDGTTCTSPDYSMKTGTLSGAPSVTRTATKASAQAVGFIVTSSALGTGGSMGGGRSSSVYIIDADGAVVWYVAGPAQCSRARMDYEGANMWMLALNVGNTGGEMRYVSMDGQTGQDNVSGLSSAHHDFTVLPGGIVAAMVWASSGADPESNLIEREPSGTLTTKFRIGSNLYAGGPSFMGGSGDSYHCNYVVYHESDDSYTISDRNPNLVVKVTRAGSPVWQIGGDCGGAPAPQCASGTWKVNHGHDFDPNGNMLLFNNGQSGASHVFEFQITDSGSFGITTIKDFTSGNYSSSSMGDVQRLPNGNTLITYSRDGVILEVDPSWATVQTFSGEFGYAEWREALYGPPCRL